MSEQLSLPLARRTDPPSSHRAAEAITRSGQRAAQKLAVLQALQRFDGSTSRELSELAGLDRYAVARRLPELERDGRVKRITHADRGDTRWYVMRRWQEIRNPLLCSERG